MRKELADIYENLFLDYPYSLREGYRPFFYDRLNISKLIHRRIVIEEDRFIRDGGQYSNSDNVELRSDAKYFLMLIFYQMVALPLQHPNIARDIEPEILADYITRDITLLMRYSYEIKVGAEVKEVTAHTILTAIDQKWEVLNISNFKLWNR